MQDPRSSTTQRLEQRKLMYVVDTDVLIDIQRGNAAALAWFVNFPLCQALL